MTQSVFRGGSCSSSTRAVHAGGNAPSTCNVIEFVQIMTTGNAIDFGDTTVATHPPGYFSNGHGGLG